MHMRLSVFAVLASCVLFSQSSAAGNFTMQQALDYPYALNLAANEKGGHIAWVKNLRGVRNVWAADAPSFKPRQVTQYRQDDGQEITQLTFSPDGSHLLYVLGGDHDANWPAEGNLAPDPAMSAQEPKVTIWAASLSGGAPMKIAEGDHPAISAKGVLAYIKDNQVWTTSLDGKGKPQRLLFDRGKDGNLLWSPDGSRLAFVSDRDDHSFIGIYSGNGKPLLYLSPSTSFDNEPVWSPEGKQIAFVRRSGNGGPVRPLLTQTPERWSIWVANTGDGSGSLVWKAPNTMPGSYPDIEGEVNLHWAADGNRLVFMNDLDNWPHLYSISLSGGAPLLLTPGNFMVEHVTESIDRKFMIYDANTGTTDGDYDRRHIFRVPVDSASPTALTSGESLEWTPVAATNDRVAFIAATAQQPPGAGIVGIDGTHRAVLDTGALPQDFPVNAFVTPKPVTFKAADGVLAHGQLFQSADSTGPKPAVIFVHGGPPRQMLLGWHYFDYYSNAYAVNQYLTNHGFVVLALNYRLGIGYGRAFHQPAHWGPSGASEYQDVVAGAKFLQSTPGVDPKRIGIWGGSYGGYLTGLALGRNSNIFKAGVDLHGVHDWSRLLSEWFGKPSERFEKGDREQSVKVAWASSPDSAIPTWKSPVLLIQGDDDRNVDFQQTIDLARRLDDRDLPYEEIVIPNEIHGFLRHASWLRADTATADFLSRKLGVSN